MVGIGVAVAIGTVSVSVVGVAIAIGTVSVVSAVVSSLGISGGLSIGAPLAIVVAVSSIGVAISVVSKTIAVVPQSIAVSTVAVVSTIVSCLSISLRLGISISAPKKYNSKYYIL